MSEGVEWCLHSLVLLAAVPGRRCLSAARLAEYHGVPAPYLAKHLQAMSRAGLVQTVPGPRGGYRLARPPEAITALDVVVAVEGPGPPFVCTEIRRQGPTALPDACYRVACGVHRAMNRAEDAYRAALGATTVADLMATTLADADPEGLAKAAGWMARVLA